MQIGQILNERYELQKQLGKKAGRQTFLARDRETENLVVVKLLTFNPDFEWDDLKLFEREAQTLRSLSHEAIPKYLDDFEVDWPNCKGFALVQTYIEAKSLEQHLQGGRSFSEAEIRELAAALLSILEYLHSQSPPVIHRDLKPSNILLGDRSGNSVGQVYLVDFGSVQTIAAREGGTITVVGTYGYMPPEQFGGRATPASDLYSLGATLIYLATGIQPADLPQKDLRIQFEQTANLSPWLITWLKRLVEPSLERRFATAALARENWQLLENQTLSAPSLAEIKREEVSSTNRVVEWLSDNVVTLGILAIAIIPVAGAVYFGHLAWGALSGLLYPTKGNPLLAPGPELKETFRLVYLIFCVLVGVPGVFGVIRFIYEGEDLASALNYFLLSFVLLMMGKYLINPLFALLLA